MDITMHFLTEEEIARHQPNFNPKFVTPEYLKEVLSDLPEKPVWYERNLEERPETTLGISICRNCRQIYWITPVHDAYESIRTKRKTIPGPFCETCFDRVSAEALKDH